MNTDMYLMTKIEKITGKLAGFTKTLEQQLVSMPKDATEFNKKLLSWQQDLKPGQCYKFQKVTVNKKYHVVEAQE